MPKQIKELFGEPLKFPKRYIKTLERLMSMKNKGNISITDSLNFSSSLDVTAGKSTISFSNNMATAKGYSIAGANADGSDQTAYQYQSQPLQDGSVATGSIALVHSYVTSNASGIGDYAYWSYSIHGDIAWVH